MITEILLAVSGFQRCRITPLETLSDKHGKYEFFQLDKWAEDEWADGVLLKFPNGIITQICSPKQFPQIKKMIEDETDLFALIKENLNREIAAAKEGKRKTTPGHWAKGLDRFVEVEEARTEFDRIKAERDAEERKQKALGEELKKQHRQEKLKAAEEEFSDGKAISSNMFEGLLELYEIKVPLRTLGWIRERLNSVSKDSYTYSRTRKGQKGSRKVSELSSDLYAAIQENLKEVS